jgi:hypothetical protein
LSMTTGFGEILKKFIIQAQMGDLKKSDYPKNLGDLRMEVSFGMGAPARIPWIAFLAPEMKVSNGFYPVYLYYKAEQVLILAYGVSETEEYGESWPAEVQNRSQSIETLFGKKVPRYGDSFVFKVYQLSFAKRSGSMAITYKDNGELATDGALEADLNAILTYYGKAVLMKIHDENSTTNRGLFYMEKELENFIIQNWNNTEFGKRFDLIIEDGELISQQYRTDNGPIDILAKDKKDGNYVVIELKKNQTSDDTAGQLARYMGWIKRVKKDNNVKGIIVAGTYDKKLDDARLMIPNTEVFLYEVNFKLSPFKK